MPQDSSYTLTFEDSTAVIIDAHQLPDGFHQLSKQQQQAEAMKIMRDHISTINEAERPVTYKDFVWPLSILFVFALIILWIAKKIRDNPKLYDSVVKLDGKPNPHYGLDREKPDYITVTGSKFKLKDEEYHFILNKYHTYYNILNADEKVYFISRLKKFIHTKTFFIHDTTGFREMPVLISASAIQLTFGLQEFLLAAYPHIHIHPEEFLRTNPSICFLEGSVSGHSIYISWKHFMMGSNIPADGQHVGLHELAHAYHCQYLEKGIDVDTTFCEYFEYFNHEGQKVFDQQKQPGNDFYSEYALKDFQEFWAESIERYFERPLEMKDFFPELYSTISKLLNQDHAHRLRSTFIS